MLHDPSFFFRFEITFHFLLHWAGASFYTVQVFSLRHRYLQQLPDEPPACRVIVVLSELRWIVLSIFAWRSVY